MSAAAYWNQAMTYDQYLDQMSERRDEYDRNFTAADIGTRQRLRYGTGELRFLVITED